LVSKGLARKIRYQAVLFEQLEKVGRDRIRSRQNISPFSAFKAKLVAALHFSMLRNRRRQQHHCLLIYNSVVQVQRVSVKKEKKIR